MSYSGSGRHLRGFSLRLGTAEADVRRGLVRTNPVTKEDSDTPRTIGPCSAAYHPVLAGFGTSWVLARTSLVVGAIEPIADPLGDITGHVENPECIRLVLPNGRGALGDIETCLFGRNLFAGRKILAV